MTEIVEWIKHVVDTIITALGYPGIALVMFAENVFPPIPSELVMPFAGFQVAEGKMTFVLAMIAGTVGAVLGALVLYFVGLWSNEVIIRRFVRRFGSWFLLSEEDLDRTLSFFARHGEAVVFFGRLIPIVRSLISIPAGMNRMPMWRFLIWTTAGATIWNLALTTAGYYLGANWETVLGFVKRYEYVVLAAVLLGAAYFIFTRLRKRRQVGMSAK